jgi:glucokinase
LAAIGIDIGGTAAKLALVDASEIRARDQVATRADLTFEELVSRLAAAVFRLTDSPTHRSPLSPAGVGVAAPGFLAPDGSGVVNVTNLPRIDGKPLRDALAASTSLRVVVDNDANAAAMGEFTYGAGRGAARLLVATVGTGIGAGMVVDGRLARVAWQGLGDPGHVTVARDGPRCACGAAGCLEALAAVPATLRRAAEMGARYPDFADLATAARAGDGTARSALRESGAWLGVGLAAWTHLLAPDRILLGGGAVDAAGDLLLPAVEESYDAHVQPFLRARSTLGHAALGNDAGVLGAAALVGGLA